MYTHRGLNKGTFVVRLPGVGNDKAEKSKAIFDQFSKSEEDRLLAYFPEAGGTLDKFEWVLWVPTMADLEGKETFDGEARRRFWILGKLPF